MTDCDNGLRLLDAASFGLRDRALFDLAIDSELRGCDVVRIKIGDLVSGGKVRPRAMVRQQKTGRPVQFEILDPARTSLLAWLNRRGGSLDDLAFPSRIDLLRVTSARVNMRTTPPATERVADIRAG